VGAAVRNRPNANILDLANPMRSLREAADLTKAAMARARGIRPPSVADAEASGGAVSVDKLVEAAASVGLELVISVRPRDL